MSENVDEIIYGTILMSHHQSFFTYTKKDVKLYIMKPVQLDVISDVLISL
jgi:hypothetical protein